MLAPYNAVPRLVVACGKNDTDSLKVAMILPMYQKVLNIPATVARCKGGAISTKSMGAATVLMVEKKLRRNRAPMKEDKVGATAVNTADTHIKNELTAKVILRPRQSQIQVNRAPAI
jgi:galactitol-specific phosphotransferase system IIB component